MSNDRPHALILAGPNGAGKTTFAHQHLRSFSAAGTFFNADEAARGIAPDDAENAAVAAGRLVLARRSAAIAERRSFAVETTLASVTLLRDVPRWRDADYDVHLYFLFISSPQICDFRVKHRVLRGGHNIPWPDIERRHRRGLQLLDRYVAAVDFARIYHAEEEPRLLATVLRGHLTVVDPAGWETLRLAVAAVGG